MVKQLTFIATKITKEYLQIPLEFPVIISTNINNKSGQGANVGTRLNLDFSNLSRCSFDVSFRANNTWFKDFSPKGVSALKKEIESLCFVKQNVPLMWVRYSEPILDIKKAETTHRLLVDIVSKYVIEVGL